MTGRPTRNSYASVADRAPRGHARSTVRIRALAVGFARSALPATLADGPCPAVDDLIAATIGLADHREAWPRVGAQAVVRHAGAIEAGQAVAALDIAALVQRVAFALPGRGIANVVRRATIRAMPAIEGIAAATIRIADAGHAIVHIAIGRIADTDSIDATVAAIAGGGIAGRPRCRFVFRQDGRTGIAAARGFGRGIDARADYPGPGQSEYAFQY